MASARSLRVRSGGELFTHHLDIGLGAVLQLSADAAEIVAEWTTSGTPVQHIMFGGSEPGARKEYLLTQ